MPIQCHSDPCPSEVHALTYTVHVRRTMNDVQCTRCAYEEAMIHSKSIDRASRRSGRDEVAGRRVGAWIEGPCLDDDDGDDDAGGGGCGGDHEGDTIDTFT